jgi:hypothetical protein
MSWDARDYGTHISQGVEGPRPTWYFAEGASGIFDMFYLIQNPGDQEATIDATFFRPEPLAPVTRTLTVPAHSRGTFKANDDGELKSGEMGARFAARDALPIIVDRSMYPSLHGLLYEAGSTSVGSPLLDTHWTFAEGATGSFFDTFLLLMNPGESPASVSVHFTFEGGGTLDKSYTVAAQSRRSIFVDIEDPLLKSNVFALDVDSTNEVPIVAERTVYWPGGNWYGSKSGLGANAPAVSWLLSDATVDAETTTYLLVKGTSDTSTSVEVQLLFADGSPSASSVVTVPPQGRATINLRELFPDASGKRFALLLLVQGSGESPAPIVVEFASYRTVDGVTWSAGDGGLLVPLR